MIFKASLLLPLACALTYVFGALAVKRATTFGVGVWRTSFLSNVAMAVLFVPVCSVELLSIRRLKTF